MKLENGRRHLWQWELNQRLIVDENCTIVQFGNGTMTNAMGVEVKEENGIKYAEIPNILLQTAADLHVYAWNEEKTSVVGHTVFAVEPMPKPAQYAYSQTEIKQYDMLLEELESKVAYYMPSVDAEGNLSWGKSMESIPDIPGANIRGPQGEKGEKGEGWSASYKITGSEKQSKWCRIANISRVINGTLNLDLFQGSPSYMVQNVSLDISGYVRWEGDTGTAKPVIVQKYNNIYGVDGVIADPLKQARITKIRVAYPKRGVDYGAEGKFPNPDADGEYQSINNPVYCYIDALVEFDRKYTLSSSPYLNVNYTGMSTSKCVPITTQTVVNDSTLGTYGEQLDFHEFVLNADIDFYMPDRKLQAKEIHAENLLYRKQYELIEEITLTEDVKSISRTAEPMGKTYNFSAVSICVDAETATKDFVITLDSRKANNGRIVQFSTVYHHNDMFPSALCFKLYNDNGMADFYAYDNKGVYRSINYYGKQWENVWKITLQTDGYFPAGAIISIYGIRE